MTGHALISKIRSRALQIYIKQTAELEQKFISRDASSSTR
jgi:hypothetical protein